MSETSKDDLKIKKFLEIKLEEIQDKNKPKLLELIKFFKKSFEYLENNNITSVAKRAKEELLNLSYEDLENKNIKNLENLNEHFHNIYSVVNILSSEEKNIEPPIIENKVSKKVTHIETFAIPTVSEMFGILPMFAGSPQKIIQAVSKSLKTPKEERTNQEQNEIDKFVDSVFITEKNIDYAEGKEIVKENGYILVCDNPIVQAKAEASENYLGNKEGLISYIKKTYGAEGLRHLLTIMIGLEENGRKGICKISINEHLERMGYTKKSSGGYEIELKKTAAEIIYILSSLYVTIIRKKNKDKVTIKAMKLFNLEGIKVDLNRNEMINNEFYITTTSWYNEAFLATENKSPKYTRLLKSITHENHLHHSLTIYLTTVLSVFWRMNSEFEIKVLNLMEWCDLDVHSHNKMYHLKSLEKELNYMKQKDYIGSWENKDSNLLPSACPNPLNCTLRINPPNWLIESLLQIEEKNSVYKFIEEHKGLGLEEFEKYFKNSNLTIKEFCEKIDITPRMFHLIKRGERSVSENITRKILNNF